MSVTLVQEAAEALNGGLFKTGLFEALGNSEGGRVDWWAAHGSERHKVIRVQVQRVTLGFCVVVAEWPVIGSDRTVFKAHTSWTIPTASQTRDNVIDATAAVVENVLVLWKDILQGTGLAHESAIPAGAKLTEEGAPE